MTSRSNCRYTSAVRCMLVPDMHELYNTKGLTFFFVMSAKKLTRRNLPFFQKLLSGAKKQTEKYSPTPHPQVTTYLNSFPPAGASDVCVKTTRHASEKLSTCNQTYKHFMTVSVTALCFVFKLQ